MRLARIIPMLALVAAMLVWGHAAVAASTDVPGGDPVWVDPYNGGSNFLIIEDSLPWGLDTNEATLTALGAGYEYDVTNAATFGAFDLAAHGIKVIIVASDQTTSFYSTLYGEKDKLADFVSAGGVLLAHAADAGWNMGTWESNPWLPGGVTRVQDYNDVLTPDDPSHPVLAGVSDGDLDYWNWSAHDYFTNLPGGTSTIVSRTADGEPVYVEYLHGIGTVLATTMTMEWYYASRTMLGNELTYALGEWKTPELSSASLLLFGMLPVGLAWWRRRKS
jgi:hypothetical protein